MLLALLAVLLGAPRASAQQREAPSDLLDASAVPPMPEGFEAIEEDGVTWQFPAQARDLVLLVRDQTREDRARVTRDLEAPEGPVLIRIGRDPDEMSALAPPEAPPPAYAVGVTYPALSLVLLTLTAPSTWERPPVDRVLVHEWSHLSLHRAVGTAHVPVWFDEGLAIHEARERSLDRVRTLWEATVRGTLLPLDELDARFPSRPHAVDLAYAESADFVGWLLTRVAGGPGGVRRVLHRMHDGESFEVAMSETFSSVTQLEIDWRAELARRYAALPLLIGSSFAWIIVLALLVLAYRRKRREVARTLARWEAEEAREEAARLARARADVERMWRDADEEAERAIQNEGDAPLPPPGADDSVPRVVHDGREHTLH